MKAPRACRDVIALLIATARCVEIPQTASSPEQVVAGEDRNHDHALHRCGEITAHHGRQLIRLALEAQRRTLDLLVVLELKLEQANHLHCRARRPGNRDATVSIRLDHFLHGSMRDQISGGRPAVARHHNATVVAQRHARRCVWDTERSGIERAVQRCGFESDPTEQIREVRAGIVTGSEERHCHRSLSALLDV